MQVAPIDLDDFRWLVDGRGAPWLSRAAGHTGSLSSLAGRLRKELSVSRVHLVLEQIELRPRAANKFSRAAQMFFTRQLLEQATDEQIARYKARRFENAPAVVDFCCGLGGDLLALSEQPRCRGVDRDGSATILALANCRVYGRGRVDAVTATAAAELLEPDEAWHIDPDRRATGRRTTQLEFLEPSWQQIQQLRARAANGCVKLAPAAVIAETDGGREWIGSRGECRQQVLWWGSLSPPAQRTATVVHQDGSWTSVLGVPTRDIEFTPRPRRFLYEADPTVLAAGLAECLAAQHGLARLVDTAAYLTGDAFVAVPLTSPFEVLEVLPLDRRKIRKLLRERGWSLDAVKQRGSGLVPGQLLRELRTESGEAVTLVLAGQRRGTWAAVARRLPPVA